MKSFLEQTPVRFLLVGIINTIIGTAVMFAAYNILEASYWASSAANYIVGSAVSFFLNKHFTFRCKEGGFKPVIKFIASISVCYGLAYGIAKPAARALLASQRVSVQENTAMLVGMLGFTVLNYFGQRFFAFRTPEKRKENSL